MKNFGFKLIALKLCLLILIDYLGWEFASLIQGFYCICSNQLTLNETAICSWQCTGDTKENCGGSNEIANVLKIGKLQLSSFKAAIREYY